MDPARGVYFGVFWRVLGVGKRQRDATKTTSEKNKIGENRGGNRKFAKKFTKNLESRHSLTIPPASVVGVL